MKRINRSRLFWPWVDLALAAVLGCSYSAPVGSTDGGVVCATTAECGGAQVCSGGHCVTKFVAGACADTSEHRAADVCASGICLAGACCAAACSATDPVCRATTCELTTGACQFAGATVGCGPAESCSNGAHTAASSCDGRGGCALSTPKACDSLACANDGKTCLPGCHDSSVCPANQYCASGQCAPQMQAGATCGPTDTSPANVACASGACLGTFCCAGPCATMDPQCGATACDDSGACLYPNQGTSCGALQSCSGSEYTPPSACNGAGGCSDTPAHSCEPYLCDVPGAVCFQRCSAGGGECASDTYCDALRCTPKKAPGRPCGATSTSTIGQDCFSGICSGNCCAAACPADPTTNNCQGLCDTQGTCTPMTCPNSFGCSGTLDCNTACRANADCAVGAFCDQTGTSGCCPYFTAGDTRFVDGATGNDLDPCCGTQDVPCRTIRRAMDLINISRTSGLILQLSNTNGTTGWAATESYPIHLGWGVTVNAAGIFFANPNAASELFQIYAFDPADTGTVTIQGGPLGLTQDAVYIGFDPLLQMDLNGNNTQGAYFNASVAIDDAVAGETALPLVLSAAWLNANDQSGSATDLKVGPGASVTLGPSPVEMGNGILLGALNYALRGNHGISCVGPGATLRDDPTSSVPVLSIEARDTDYLDIGDGCSVKLTQGPALGGPQISPALWDGSPTSCADQTPGNDCYMQCLSFANNGAVLLAGKADLIFGSAKMPGRIHCASYGFDQETSTANGSPTVSVNGATVDLAQDIYCYAGSGRCDRSGPSCAGAMVTEGSFSAIGSAFRYSFLGIFVGPNAVSVDLFGPGIGGNTLACNDGPWSGYNYQNICRNPNDLPTAGGADLVNASGSVGVDARKTTWDQYDQSANATQVWSCSDTTYSDCTCSGANCAGTTSPGTPTDGPVAIYLSTNTAVTPLDTGGGSQIVNSCP